MHIQSLQPQTFWNHIILFLICYLYITTWRRYPSSRFLMSMLAAIFSFHRYFSSIGLIYIEYRPTTPGASVKIQLVRKHLKVDAKSDPYTYRSGLIRHRKNSYWHQRRCELSYIVHQMIVMKLRCFCLPFEGLTKYF